MSRGPEVNLSNCFNTWAREEPNSIAVSSQPSDLRFQYLGSRGAQQYTGIGRTHCILFQYLGSRGAQRDTPDAGDEHLEFQYLGSRGAQHFFDICGLTYQSFNTWAREEPNSATKADIKALKVSILGLARSPTPIQIGDGYYSDWVSILGLARSPTNVVNDAFHLLLFQYLGSRGAQLRVQQLRKRGSRFQYLGSRGAQPIILGVHLFYIKFQYLGSRGAQRTFGGMRLLRQPGAARRNAREEPNEHSAGCPYNLQWFQYLGSRGAQPGCPAP